jgi:glycosyltransferase involved in cell wall biosynthesis
MSQSPGTGQPFSVKWIAFDCLVAYYPMPMTISIVTPNRNGERFLEQAIRSVILERETGVDIEHIVVDGGSTDGSREILRHYEKDLDRLICEPDRGPAEAINKGLAAARGDLLCWLNADDFYYPGALKRVCDSMTQHPSRALCFGHCRIVDAAGIEIRKGITGFKEMFFPVSSRFVIQCINYVSQPATFFRRRAFAAAGPLRTDLRCAWDYELFLRLWRQGGAIRIGRPALSAFRWHEGSISGRHFRTQFREEWEVAVEDAGCASLQALVHFFVRWGIVGSYSAMAWGRRVRKGA